MFTAVLFEYLRGEGLGKSLDMTSTFNFSAVTWYSDFIIIPSYFSYHYCKEILRLNTLAQYRLTFF